jgi:CheY-like chemotaxis protein/anti-sigma regulatory factor (Ser/Thr protein kinase)
VEGDATRLAQVVSNLLINAAKYTNPGGLITVRGGERDQEVLLSVSDTGIGISPEIVPKVFDLFVQEPQPSDRRQGGLGLGLAIVRNLIERHGGRVSVESEQGRGSEFTVRLPRARAMQRQTSDVGVVPGPRRDVSGLRVLLVDDNEDSAEMLAEFLSLSGHHPRVAHDGPAALSAVRTFVPDIAFLDIGLPVMDGYELAQHLKQLPGLESVILVAVTGYGQDSDYARSRAAGFHHHLVKPVDLSAIEEVLAAFGKG